MGEGGSDAHRTRVYSVQWVVSTVRSTSKSVCTDIKVMRTDLEVNRTVSDTHRTDSGPMGIGHPPLPSRLDPELVFIE